jgi:hypothetical protein
MDDQYPDLVDPNRMSMYFVMLDVLGIKFQFVEGGVVLDPGRHDLDDPQVIAALKKAYLIHPWLNVLCSLESAHHYLHIERELKSISPETLERYLSQAAGVLEQPYIEAPDWLPGFLALLQGEDQRRKAKEAAEKQRQAKRAGFVYLLRSSDGHFKIGRTKNPENRRATFGVKLPFRVEYLHLIPCADMHKTERQLHERFADRRIDGEWFALTPEDVSYIQSMGGER